MSRAEKKAEDLRSQLSSKANELIATQQKMKKTITELEAEVSSLKASQSGSAGDLKKAKTKISKLEKDAAALSKKLVTTEGALTQSHEMIESLKKQVEELRNELTKRKKAAEAKLKMEINKVTGDSHKA